MGRERLLRFADVDEIVELPDGTRMYTFHRSLSNGDLYRLAGVFAPETVRQVGDRAIVVGAAEAVSLRPLGPCDAGRLCRILLVSIMLVALLGVLAALYPVGPLVGGLASAGLGATAGLWAAALAVLVGPALRAEWVTVVRGGKVGSGLVAVVA